MPAATPSDRLVADETRVYRGRPTWELKNVKKALSLLPFLNTVEESARLLAVNAILKQRGVH